MNPQDIRFSTELDRQFVKSLYSVKDDKSFQDFLSQWDYWLDTPVKALNGADWSRLKPVIDDARTDGIAPTARHDIAIALLMPERIIKVSLVAGQCCVPWGCAYIRMKNEKSIDY